MWKRIISILIAPIVAFIMLPALHAAAKRMPISQAEVLGLWVGLTEDDLELIRLEFAAEGRGTFGYFFSDDQPCVFRLSEWSFDSGKINLKLAEGGSCLKDRELSASISGNTLQLTMRGDGWKRRARLRKEEPLIRRWTRLKTAMDEFVSALEQQLSGDPGSESTEP